MILGCGDLVYRIHGGGDAVGPLLAHVVNGKGGGLSVKGIAIGKGDTFAQVEGIAAGIVADLPRGGEPWGDRTILIDAHESFVDIVHEYGGDGSTTGSGEIQRGGRRGGGYGKGSRSGVTICLGGINHRGMACRAR